MVISELDPPAPPLHQTFGELKRLDLRNLWPHEALSFTPWLERNLSVLGSLIGMELELIARESPVGQFSLDLLLKDVSTDRIVVVENLIAGADSAESSAGEIAIVCPGLG